MPNTPEPQTSEAEHRAKFPPTIPGHIVAVTTMHKEGLEQYGKTFLATFIKHWPKEVQLLVFSEGWDASDTGLELPENIHVEPLAQGYKEAGDIKEYGGYLQFLERFGNDTAANGWVLQKNRKQPVYSYRLDAIRFSHKVYALHKAFRMALDQGAELLLWIDADIVTHTDVPLDFLQTYLPPERDIGYLHRQAEDGGLMYPECGFVLYRISRIGAQMFLDLFRQCYETGDLFKLPEWHDSFVFFVLLKGCMEQRNLKAHSLSKGAEKTWHPFVNSPLGQYMDHLKGNRKEAGKSAKADLAAPESQPYFADAPETLPGCPTSPFLASNGKVDANQEGPDAQLLNAGTP